MLGGTTSLQEVYHIEVEASAACWKRAGYPAGWKHLQQLRFGPVNDNTEQGQIK